MIKRLFTGQINSVTIAALLVALSSLVSRFLGIFRDRILAGQFGAGDTLDVYYAAFRIPDLIFNLLVLGALSAGFVPILTCMIKDPKCKLRILFHLGPNKEAWLLVSNLLNSLVIVLMVLLVLGEIFAPWLMRWLAPGFSEAKLAETVALTRIMFLSPLLLGISSILGGVLQSFKRFFVYSLSPIFYNVGIILGALYLSPVYGTVGLAWGVVLGAFLHLLVQIPAVWGLGYSYRPVLDWGEKNFKEIIRLMGPRTMGLAISQINLVVVTIFASFLAGGSLAVFNFANNLQSFPVGIFGISFAVAVFPTLATAAFKPRELVAHLSHTIRQILFFIVPATVLLLILRAQIVRTVLGSGAFDWQDTVLTFNTLAFFSISLFAQALIPLLARVFYARHNAMTPFVVGLAGAVVNVVLAWMLAGSQLGIAGLALAFSIANIVQFMLLWLILRIEIGDMDEWNILLSTIKFSIAGLGLGVTVQGMKYLVAGFFDLTRLWGIFAQGLAAGLLGLFVYLAFCSMLKSPELAEFWEAIRRRLSWSKVDTNDQGEARGI